MLKSNCHTHTVFCDGKNTPEEMVEAAVALSFESLGFSAHSPMPYENSYAIGYDRVDSYVSEIKRLRKKYADRIFVANGIELDADSLPLDTQNFDFSIGSVHQLHFENRMYSVDYTAQMLKSCAEREFSGSFQKLAKHYFSLIYNLICEAKPDVVGHFDLIEKFNENGALFNSESREYRNAALEVVDGICDISPDIIFEINTGAMFRCGRSVPYPAKFILERLKERGMRITVTSDAHCTDALDFAFKSAETLCRSCGFKSAYIITQNGFSERKI